MAGTTKFTWLTAEVMTRGEHLRSATKDDPSYNWPDDTADPLDCPHPDLSVNKRGRFAAAGRAVGGGTVPGTKRGGGK